MTKYKQGVYIGADEMPLWKTYKQSKNSVMTVFPGATCDVKSFRNRYLARFHGYSEWLTWDKLWIWIPTECGYEEYKRKHKDIIDNDIIKVL